MYAQITKIRVPLGKMAQMRHLIQNQYLPKVQTRSGFIAGYLLEQTDDRDRAQLVVLWESQEDVEAFNRTGMLEASAQSLSAHAPGISVQREGYVVTVYEQNDRVSV